MQILPDVFLLIQFQAVLPSTLMLTNIKHITKCSYPQASVYAFKCSDVYVVLYQQLLGGQHLPWVLLDINNAPKEDTGKSAAQMVYGASLTLPAQLAAGEELTVDEILRDLADAAPIPTRHGQREAPTEPPAALATAELVYVRKGGQLQPLAQPSIDFLGHLVNAAGITPLPGRVAAIATHPRPVTVKECH